MGTRHQPGRPPNRTDFSPEMLEAARTALRRVATELGVPSRRYPTAPGSGRAVREPSALDAAVLAITLSQALELVAAEQVAKAREHDEVTWEQVGDAFEVSMQSAHARFRRPGA